MNTKPGLFGSWLETAKFFGIAITVDVILAGLFVAWLYWIVPVINKH